MSVEKIGINKLQKFPVLFKLSEYKCGQKTSVDCI